MAGVGGPKHLGGSATIGYRQSSYQPDRSPLRLPIQALLSIPIRVQKWCQHMPPNFRV